MAQFVDRDRRLMAVRDGPDNVLRPERRVPAEEHVGQGRLHRLRIDLGHAPAIELDADVALDPREGVFLADRDEHVVAQNVLVRFASRYQVAPALLIELGLDLLEQDAGQFAVVMSARGGHEEVEDRDAFVHRVLFFPDRGLHLLEARAHDDRDFLAAEAARGAAAIHCRVAAAEHDDAAADLVDMAERDGGQPVDADMDVGGGFLPAGDLELAAARRARADKDRVPALGEQRLQAADELTVAGLDPKIDDAVDLLVGHRFGQAEARDLCSHHAAALGVAVEHDAVIAERREVARDGQRGRSGADQGDALAVLLLRDGRQIRGDITLIVGGNALQAADRHRLCLDPATAAGRFAGPVAGAPEDAGKDVRLPIDRPGLGIALLGDEADVFRDRRVRRARPLAIDDFMEIVRISDIGGLQYASPAERRTRSIVRPGAFSRGRRALYAAPYTPRLIQGVRTTVIPAVGGSPQTRIAAAAGCRPAGATSKRDSRSNTPRRGLDMGARLRLG